MMGDSSSSACLTSLGVSSDRTNNKPFSTQEGGPTGASSFATSINLPTNDHRTISEYGGPTKETYLPNGEFIRFPKLPVEVRVQIWTLALRAEERVLGAGVVDFEGDAIRDGAYSSLGHPKRLIELRGHNTPILAVCTESRSEARRLLLALQPTDDYRFITEGSVPYFNPELDILWGLASSQPEWKEAWCDVALEFPAIENLAKMFANMKQWNSIAIDCFLWFSKTTPEACYILKTLDCLQKLGVSQVILMIGNQADCSHKDIIYINPSLPPTELLNFSDERAYYLLGERSCNSPDSLTNKKKQYEEDWNSMKLWVLSCLWCNLEDFRSEVEDIVGSNPTDTALSKAFASGELENFPNYREFKVPEIKYMEVTTKEKLVGDRLSNGVH